MTIRNPEIYLRPLLGKNEDFYVGLNYEDYLKKELNKYKLPSRFSEGVSFLPSARGSVSRANIIGKFKRKEPQQKTTITKRISFTKKNGTPVSYDRDFNIWVKELVHKYNAEFIFKTNQHDQKLVLSAKLNFNDVDSIKNAHILNLFHEVLGEYEIYDQELNPAIGFTNTYEFEILPKGTFDDGDLDDVVEKARRYFIKDEGRVTALQKRLKQIQKYNPELNGKGPNGFFGYIVFGFPEKDIILLESMYLNNATYVFKYSNYESLMQLDKQKVISGGLAEKRIFHYDNWEQKIHQLLA